MRAQRPLRVVSLPGRTPEELRQSFGPCAEAGADVLEIRIDRIDKPSAQRLAELFPCPLPLMATYRSSAEGGEGSEDAAVRMPILEKLARLPFRYLDFERARDSIPASHRRHDPSVVLSTHLPEGDPLQNLRAALAPAGPEVAWIKVVVEAGLAALRDRVLPALEPPPEIPYCLHTTGSSGPVLRAAALRLGMAAVYAAPPSHMVGTEKPVEASQIPVDRISALEEQSASPLFALLGSPVAHSLSPALHHEWMRRSARSGLYTAIDVPDATAFEAALDVLPRLGFVGMNVTYPHKERAVELAPRASPVAVRTRSANTLSATPDGLRADNTDFTAIRRRLGELRSIGHWDGTQAVILGLGGAGRSAALAVEELHGEAVLVGRRPGAADATARSLGIPTRPLNPGPASFIIHATPVGRLPGSLLEFDLLPLIGPSTQVLDLVYRPVNREIAEACDRAGAKYEDGTRILEYQAADSFALWWGDPAPAATADAGGAAACVG